MKRSLWFITAIVLIISLFGCSDSKAVDEVNTLENPKIEANSINTIADYYPYRENTMMVYEGVGNEYAGKTIFVEFIEENKLQIKEVSPGTTFVKVIEYKDGELREIFTEGEFYHIENMLNSNTNRNNVLLKEPLEIGNTWSNENGDVKEITGLNTKIETPSGIYEALEVTTKSKNGNIQRDYYVEDIGLVASVYKDGEFEVKTLLKEVKKQHEELEIMTYYPMANDIGTAYIEQVIRFETNDNIEEILEEILKNPPSDKLISPISQGTKINKIYLNRESWILDVDFSKEYMEDLNMGSAFEVEMLKSIVNTLGKFFDVDKVYITIEGSPYESGHFSIREGEYFTVDITNINKLE